MCTSGGVGWVDTELLTPAGFAFVRLRSNGFDRVAIAVVGHFEPAQPTCIIGGLASQGDPRLVDPGASAAFIEQEQHQRGLRAKLLGASVVEAQRRIECLPCGLVARRDHDTFGAAIGRQNVEPDHHRQRTCSAAMRKPQFSLSERCAAQHLIKCTVERSSMGGMNEHVDRLTDDLYRVVSEQ